MPNKLLAAFVAVFLFSMTVAMYPVFSDQGELKAFLQKHLNPFMDARISAMVTDDTRIVCAYYDDRCFCDSVPYIINGLKVSTLLATRGAEIKPFAPFSKEKEMCERMQPSWRVAKNNIWDTRPVRYLRTLPHPDDEKAFNEDGTPVRVAVGEPCGQQTRLSKDEEGNTVYPTGSKQWRTVEVDGKLYQAYCESYQTDSWEQQQQAPSEITLPVTRFVSKTKGSGGHEWMEESGFMWVLPQNGTMKTQADLETSASLVYTYDFKAGGTYTVWVHGVGANGGSDSLWVGLNGKQAQKMNGFQPQGSWMKASISVELLGENKINVWMREAGMKFDQIILSRNLEFTPE